MWNKQGWKWSWLKVHLSVLFQFNFLGEVMNWIMGNVYQRYKFIFLQWHLNGVQIVHLRKFWTKLYPMTRVGNFNKLFHNWNSSIDLESLPKRYSFVVGTTRLHKYINIQSYVRPIWIRRSREMVFLYIRRDHRSLSKISFIPKEVYTDTFTAIQMHCHLQLCD